MAFNQQAADGYYHIYTVNPDGSNKRQVGAGSPTFPQRTTGSPAWHPSGQYMAFVAEKTTPLPGSLAGDTFGATPGWGDYSDLWVSTADGSRAWQLTNLPVGANSGVILPEFSPNGQLLEWTEKSQGGSAVDFVIKVARFNLAADGTPYLTNVQTIAPGGSAFPNEFIETGGFSADSSQMLFTSNFQNHIWSQSQIYVLNLNTGVITRLTNWSSYDEHPRFTPGGQIIWMSNADQPAGHGLGDDWWIMNADGSNPHKLTHFNDPSNPEYLGKTVFATVVGTNSWSSDGSYFYGDLELSLLSSQMEIVRVSMTCR
jgi:Tol biopolymer transport system component